MAKEIRKYGSGPSKPNALAPEKPSAEEVDVFHTNSDLNIRAESLHHSLGTLATQASPGNHNHDGGNSVALLADLSITGSRATDDWRLSVNALLVKLGATDNSTA
jgi:hypothetical protein